MPKEAYLEALSALEAALAEVSPQEVPALLGGLERVRAALWARMMSASSDGYGRAHAAEDRLLTVEEAAGKLGVSPDWLYRRRLPFTVRLGPRQLRFSAQGIERYIRQRQGR